MDFEPCFKVYNLVSIRPKSMKLGQMINLNVIFHMMGSVYRLVTIRNSPQFPVEFRNGLLNAGKKTVAKICVGSRTRPSKLKVDITCFFGICRNAPFHRTRAIFASSEKKKQVIQ